MILRSMGGLGGFEGGGGYLVWIDIIVFLIKVVPTVGATVYMHCGGSYESWVI